MAYDDNVIITVIYFNNKLRLFITPAGFKRQHVFIGHSSHKFRDVYVSNDSVFVAAKIRIDAGSN